MASMYTIYSGIAIMIIIGFGFLMTFLKWSCWQICILFASSIHHSNLPLASPFVFASSVLPILSRTLLLCLSSPPHLARVTLCVSLPVILLFFWGGVQAIPVVCSGLQFFDHLLLLRVGNPLSGILASGPPWELPSGMVISPPLGISGIASSFCLKEDGVSVSTRFKCLSCT